MVAPVPLLCWATARRLTGNDTVAVLAAVVPVTMPGLTRLAGSVNNDNLLILLGSVLLYLLARVVTGDLSVRTGIWVGLTAALALLTKGFALAFPPVIAAAYGIAWLRRRTVAWRPALVAGLLTAAVGGWWWVRNLVLYDAVQPAGFGARWTEIIRGPARPGGQVSTFVPGFARGIVIRFWGGIGLPDNPRIPDWTAYGWLLLAIAGAVAAVALGWQGQRWSRAVAVLFALPAVVSMAIVFEGSLHSYLFNQRFSGVQGRYAYGGLVGIAVLAAWGWSRLAGRHARYLPALVLAAGLATQAYAWLLLLLGWWAPRSGVHGLTRVRQALDGVARWSPWPESVTAVTFLLVPVLGVLALLLAGRHAVTPAAADGPPPAGQPAGEEDRSTIGSWPDSRPDPLAPQPPGDPAHHLPDPALPVVLDEQAEIPADGRPVGGLDPERQAH
jgi:hypothetical protein